MEDFKLNKDLKYNLFKKSERQYWKNFEVNIDRLCDKWVSYRDDLKNHLNQFSPKDIRKAFLLLELTPKSSEYDFVETFLSDLRASILLYCIIEFVSHNPKAISREFKIPIRKGKINKVRVYLKTLETYRNDRLVDLYLLLLVQKNGRADHWFDVNRERRDLDFEKMNRTAQTLVRFLNRIEKKQVEYHLRFSKIVHGDFLFLFLKETVDKIIPALPDNIRVQQGKLLLVTLQRTGRLNIHTKSRPEATLIKNYFAKKTKSIIKYTKEFSEYDPKKFFQTILSKDEPPKAITLLHAEFRRTSIGDQVIEISDSKRRNDISHVIRWLKEKEILRLNDFSEFKTLVFSFKSIGFPVQIHESRWGQLRLVIADQKKPKKELREFKIAFTAAFNIPLDVFLKNKDDVFDKIMITRRIINNKTISSEMPIEVENILLDLINNKFVRKPEKSAKRRCEICRHIFWTKGDCPVCGHESYFEGDYIDIEVDEYYFIDYLYKSISIDKKLRTKKIRHQIEGHSFIFIEVMDEEGNFLSIYVSKSHVPAKVMDHFYQNGNPLLILLLKFKEAIQTQITERNFECCDFSEIVHTETKNIPEIIKAAIEQQKRKWQSKIIEAANFSLNRISSKPSNYNDQHFEKDIYNLLHEIFPIANRLGGKFAGVKAPDGIISIQNYRRSHARFCLAWDCKYSTLQKGYNLTDDPSKHKYYLTKLGKNDTVNFFGGLRTYAFISQNMNTAKYASFYKKLIAHARWKGEVILIQEKNILLIHKVYKNNEFLIKNYPSVFYMKLFSLFRKVLKKESAPYKFISEDRIKGAMEDLKTQFKKSHQHFDFNRSDFDAL